MNNPFESIEARLSNIESLILDLKHKPQATEQPPSTENLLSVKGAAAFLHLSVATIYSKVSRGELPFMKANKKLYFSQEELLEYVKSGRSKTNREIEAESDKYVSKNINNG